MGKQISEDLGHKVKDIKRDWKQGKLSMGTVKSSVAESLKEKKDRVKEKLPLGSLGGEGERISNSLPLGSLVVIISNVLFSVYELSNSL
jgi:hypothetical protein